MRSSDIPIRDPFIIRVPEEGLYYLYGTSGWGNREPEGADGPGFWCYWSRDLVEWEGPANIFRPPTHFWGTRDFWAPEVHRVNGSYVILASFMGSGQNAVRGTQVLKADGPCGPFIPWSEGPVTPKGWHCLDGTLWWEDGIPWLVFCHEWTQIGDGEVLALELASDLRAQAGTSSLLFRASDAPWTADLTLPRHLLEGNAMPRTHGRVTDGPFVFLSMSGELCMLWSSFVTGGTYALGVARSTSGRLAGPWQHDAMPVYALDGGHGMLFSGLDGKTTLALHSPNARGLERLQLLPFPLGNVTT